MSIATKLEKLTTDITSAYTSIENKGGTIPSDKNTDNLHTAIDSIEVIEQATAEGESISLANTKAMPYKDYVVEGKSEQTTRSGKNLWNDNDMLLGYWAYADGTYIRTNTWICTPKIACKGNVDYTFQFANNSRWYGFVWYDENNNFISTANQQNNLQTGFRSFTAKSPSNAGYLAINIAGYPGTNDTIRTDDLINFQLEESSTATDYEPYGASPSPEYPSEIHSVADEGTVTIKQRGKNKFDYKQIMSNASITIENGGFVINNTDFQHGSLIGILKNLCPELKVGDKFKFNWDTNATRNNSDVNYIYLNLYANTIRKDITYICTQEMLDSETYFYGQQGEYYKDIIFYLDGQTSDYEPYQANDYTFQTEPLCSLPNGVKDTMELQDMQNHTRIGRQTGTLTETTIITLSDAKTNGAYMCNIKPSGTLTGKTIELEAGDYEIIYELEEETIEPLTQQQANTMLDIIKTGSYEGTTNIYTDEDVKPTMKVDYYKKK